MNTDEYEFIIGYENLYKINRRGDVYSCHYKKIMTQLVKDDGYLYVDLRRPELIDNVITRTRHKGYIHRLLGKQFIPNPEDKPEIDHIDRCKTNNTLENIRWVSRLENIHNKTNYKDNLTPEQLEARKARTRERARLWARKNTALKKEFNRSLIEH
jgi:hypothetical protein